MSVRSGSIQRRTITGSVSLGSASSRCISVAWTPVGLEEGLEHRAHAGAQAVRRAAREKAGRWPRHRWRHRSQRGAARGVRNGCAPLRGRGPAWSRSGSGRQRGSRPSALAIARIVAPRKPRSAKTAAAAAIRRSRVSARGAARVVRREGRVLGGMERMFQSFVRNRKPARGGLARGARWDGRLTLPPAHPYSGQTGRGRSA